MNAKLLPKLLLLPASLTAVLGLSLWHNVRHTPLEASSHREAPLIADDPVADNTDLYAFRDPNHADRIVVIANYIPFELPHGGPNYSTFGENVRYEVHVKNDGSKDGDDITYRFTFKRVNEDPSTFFNIRLGKQNLKTTYTCEKSTDGGKSFSTIVTDGVVAPNNVGPRSINSAVGLNQPSYTDLRLKTITAASGGGNEQVFCGPSDDPFFADLGAIFDLANLRPTNATDGLSRKNCHSIALSIPITTLQKNHQDVTAAKNFLDSDFVIGVWASASRPAMQTFSTATGAGTSGEYVQVSRLGMPLTNEVINPIGSKDRWNARTPYTEDAQTDDYLSNPELGLYVDNRLFGGAVPQLMPLAIQTKSLAGFPGLPANGFDFGNTQPGLYPLKGAKALDNTALADAAFGNYLLVAGKPRSVDIKPIFHTGVPNLAPYQLATGKPKGNPLAPGKPFVNNFLPLGANASGNPGGDMLRLNMAVPATPRTLANGQANPEFSNQGLLQAAVLGLTDSRYNTTTDIQNIPNMDGFPNGRRLEDAVDQIELKAVGGLVLAAIGLWYDDYTPASTSPLTPRLLGEVTFTTGVEKNDTTIRADFPFVQTPWVGTGSASGPTNTVVVPDMMISNATTVDAGTYNNVTIMQGGVGTFNGPIVVNGTLTVQDGGVLSTRGVLATSCQAITGTGSFVLQAGGTLRVCDPAGLTTTGSTGAIQLSGSRTFSPDANYEYNGTEAQLSGPGLPSQVRSLTVSNGATLTLNNGGVSIMQTLALTSGNLNTSSSQPLTLLSTPRAGTALVVNTNGVVNGPATMQRAINPAFNDGPGYRHYSSPVSNTTLADLTNTPGFTPIFNTAYNTAGANSGSVTPYPNVFAYDQARVTDPSNSVAAFDQGFFVPQPSDAMAVLTGYDLNISPNALVDLTGTLNNGAVSRSVSSGTLTQSGWQFLGNPYPSPIDFSQTAGVTRTNVDDAVYVYQSTGQYVGQYRSYVNGMGNPLVAAMQGFFSKVSTGQTTGSFALNNAIRVTSFAAEPSFYRTAETRPLVQLQLQGAQLPLADEAYVYFEQGAGAGYDAKFDAYKLPSSSGLSVSSLIQGGELSINGLAPFSGLGASLTVPLNVSVPAAGTYSFNAASILNFTAGTRVYLLDTETGTRTDLLATPTYSFTAAAKALPGRFSLYFGPATALAINNAALAQQVQLFPNPTRGSFTLVVPAGLGASSATATLYNQLGQLVSQRTLPLTAAGATAQFDVSLLTPGVYTLQLAGSTAQVVKRVVVQ
ncbi:MAG: DUF4331 family protein [Janthinobacterium lividum]